MPHKDLVARAEYTKQYYARNKEKVMATYREWYADNREAILEKAKKRYANGGKVKTQLGKRLNRAWVNWHKENNPCKDCGRYYPYDVMHFDHRDLGTKIAKISALLNGGVDREVLLEEINKCDLVCMVCHAKRTMRQLHPELQP